MRTKINTELIAKYIKDNGLTVKAFCKQCDISVNTFYRIMNGKNIKLVSLGRIVKAMGICSYQIFK